MAKGCSSLLLPVRWFTSRRRPLGWRGPAKKASKFHRKKKWNSVACRFPLLAPAQSGKLTADDMPFGRTPPTSYGISPPSRSGVLVMRLAANAREPRHRNRAVSTKDSRRVKGLVLLCHEQSSRGIHVLCPLAANSRKSLQLHGQLTRESKDTILCVFFPLDHLLPRHPEQQQSHHELRA